MADDLIVSVPEQDIADRLGDLDGTRVLVWPMREPAPVERIDLVVSPYIHALRALPQLGSIPPAIVQGQALGYNGVEEVLPAGFTFCNARGVHEASTAELALALTLASLRGIPDFVRLQDARTWSWPLHTSLADRTVLVIGQGGLGRAIAERFIPFEVTLLRSASKARTDDLGPIHGPDELPALVAQSDVIVLAVPLTDATTRLVDTAFLNRMRPGALLVNMARGKVVDTDALVEATTAGRVHAALDVMDPEPLPGDHPLWRAPNVLISPHVGGNTTAMAPRIDRLIREQVVRLRAGDEPANVVVRA